MLKSAFELRYQVYCLEEGFLNPNEYPDGLEFDEYDDASAHFGSLGEGGDLIGYVRLVKPTAGGFPFQQHCVPNLPANEMPTVQQSAEVSRLMVRQDYRRGRTENLRRVEDGDIALAKGRPPSQSSRILMHLYRQMYAYSVENDIRYWYAAMESSLARSLRSCSFVFKQISDVTDYFGPVALYCADLRDVERRLQVANPALLDWIQGCPSVPQPQATGWSSNLPTRDSIWVPSSATAADVPLRARRSAPVTLPLEGGASMRLPLARPAAAPTMAD